MHRMNCVLMSLLLMITDERLRVSGSSRSISASVGEDVTLNCSVDSNITHEDLKVSWKKTDKDGDIVVLLYQNNEASPEASIERYRDRVEFFTDEIHKGNFSLRLKSVRTEDKGVYMCEVSAGGLSANTTVELERLSSLQKKNKMRKQIIGDPYTLKRLTNPFFFGFEVKCSHHTLQPATMEHLKVEWRRTDSDFLVHLYVDGKSGADEQHQDYRDRAHFITEEIQHGNLSLRLDNLRTEDEGRYTCTVYRQKKYVFSVKKNVEMWLLGK
ncbi:Butyrophilin-like protein 2 [Labeo rohita]|uniref:Butyrophilin-like protein 2 n=1 Tax=Labeo rohita TaxID=84645 RepID=A0ABQ8L8A7_LABRO|nr:Butyrophilin-like protein 2 [Labeo rohita]